MPGPLDGIRVVEWAMFHNGPAAGYMLGDLGAEVIKIEQPGVGDAIRGMSQMYGDVMTVKGRHIGFELANRNKKGIALDLTTPKGKEITYQLIAKSDVFYHNYRKAVADKLKMDYETLRQHNPKLIYAHNSSYGTQGPFRSKRGFDTIAQARSGLMSAMGDRDTPEPVQMIGAPCDQTGATMLAYAILAALVARERQGIGQALEVSLLGGSIHLQAINLNNLLLRGRPAARHSQSRARNPLANHYRCADNKWLMLAEPQADRYWSQFCHVMGLEELETDPRFATAIGGRREHYKELIDILNTVFVTKPRDEWVKRFEERGAEFAYSPVQDYYEVIQDPQVLENEYLVDYDHPVLGKVKLVNTPIKFTETPSGPRSEAPELGQHTEEVLTELLGYSWDDVGQLREEGVIG